MAWPDNLKRVKCEGFSNSILPIIRKAVDDERVEWIPGTQKLFVDLGTGQFKFAGCVWELEEMTEMVTRVSLLKGQLKTEDLTFAVLRG